MFSERRRTFLKHLRSQGNNKEITGNKECWFARLDSTVLATKPSLQMSFHDTSLQYSIVKIIQKTLFSQKIFHFVDPHKEYKLMEFLL